MPDDKEFFMAKHSIIDIGASKQQQMLDAVFEADFFLISYA
jgi:hypothetical protein